MNYWGRDKYILVRKACGKPGRSGGMGNFNFGPFIRHNLVESGTVFTQPFVVSFKLL